MQAVSRTALSEWIADESALTSIHPSIHWDKTLMDTYLPPSPHTHTRTRTPTSHTHARPHPPTHTETYTFIFVLNTTVVTVDSEGGCILSLVHIRTAFHRNRSHTKERKNKRKLFLHMYLSTFFFFVNLFFVLI